MADWYCNSNGQQQGPMNSPALKQLAASGQLRPTDLVWKDGMAQWAAASTITGLFTAPAQTAAAAVPVDGPMYACSVCGTVYGVDNVYDNGGGTYICKQCHAQRTGQYPAGQYGGGYGGVPNYAGPYTNPYYRNGASPGLIVGGYVCAFMSLVVCALVFGIAGISIGINVKKQGSDGHGTAIIVLSSICSAISIIFVLISLGSRMH